MARKRGRKRGGGRGGGEPSGDAGLTRNVEEFQDVLDGLTEALGNAVGPFGALVFGASEAGQALGGFAKNAIEHSSEFKRAQAALSDLSSSLAFSSAQAAAGSISPGFGQLVGGARGFLGNFAATGNAAQDLEDASAQMAFQGMPMDKDLQQSLFPLLKARRQAVEQARQQSSDVTRSEVQGSLSDSIRGGLEAIGFGDVYRMFINGGNARTP